MARTITPVEDLKALIRLWLTIRRLRPDVVHAHTPKGGLLGTTAAFLARVPTRVYHLRGLPMMTAAGPKRWLLRAAERTTCALAHQVIGVGTSIRRTALAEGLCSSDKIVVLARGSGQGVDLSGRFHLETVKPHGARVRRELDIPSNALVIGFVGRLVGDKGICELAEAWQTLRIRFKRAYLLLVGPEEVRDAVPESVLQGLRADARVRFTGYVEAISEYYAAMDVVAFPSYREGFPNVPLEAAAMGLPIVVSDIPGCREAVLADETARVVPSRDAESLRDALAEYLSDPEMRSRHGEAGRSFVATHFSQEVLTRAVLEEYDRLLRDGKHSNGWLRNWYRRRGKRLFDGLSAGIALIALGLPLTAIAILIRLDSPGPVFFNQDRVGRGGKTFRLFKFRTMTNRSRVVDHEIRAGDPEVTRIGALLRRLKIDELPQLMNILKGDMSLIGPRPTVPEQLPGFTELAWKRLDERPGLTGLAQINGNTHLTWPERWEYDDAYVADVTLRRDLRILVQTVLVVLRGEGRYLNRPRGAASKEQSP